MLASIYSSTAIQTIIAALPAMLEGSFVTLLTVIGALFIGCLLGVPMAFLYLWGGKGLRSTVALYLWFFRGVPILPLLLLFYFGIFEALGLNVSTISTSCIVLGLVSAAYQTQLIKGAVQAAPQGQLAAAQALGMTRRQAARSIVFPQAFRLALPGWINEYSILLKDSSLCFALGTPELMAKTGFVASRTYEHLALYIAAGCIYFLLTIIGIFSLTRLARRLFPFTLTINKEPL